MRWSELLLAALLALSTGCQLGREYVGSELRLEALDRLLNGRSTKGEVLQLFGPPDRILRQYDGDVFIYRYVRRNTASFSIEEPVITNFQIFSWSKEQEKADRLVVLFDRQGIVSAWGLRRGTEELDAL